MSRIIVTSKVGSDGVLHLTLPLEPAVAGQDVLVTIEPVIRPVPSPEEWRQAVLATAGQWQGDFERPPQTDYEEREPLA
jgi:hypothetical protein